MNASHADVDTHLMPVLFRDGSDRRSSARIPLGRPVRVGPPGQRPSAVVSAADISTQGLFIDADRPVRVGARFCAEIELEGGRRVYIDEAEVAYNRDRPHGSGFGVRFVKASEEALHAIRQEIDILVAKTAERPIGASISDRTVGSEVPGDHVASTAVPMSARPHGASIVSSRPVSASPAAKPPLPSAMPTIVPEMLRDSRAPSVLGVDLSSDREPLIIGEALDLERPGQTLTPQSEISFIAKAKDGVAMARQRFIERAHRSPATWTTLLGAGACLIAASVVLVAVGGVSSESEPVDLPEDIRRVDAATHQVLMGKGAPLPIVEKRGEPGKEAHVPSSPPKNPLPPLVMLGEPAAAPEAVKEPVISTPESPSVAETKPKTEPTLPPKRAPAAARPAGPSGRLSLDVGPSVRVIKSFVLKSPPRFVVDLSGDTTGVVAPTGTGGIRSVRLGKHEGFTRLVIDSDRAIVSGSAVRSGSRIDVQIVH